MVRTYAGGRNHKSQIITIIINHQYSLLQTRVGVERARKWADRIGNGLGPDDLFISADTDEVWIHIQMKKANKQVLTNIVCKICFYQAKVRSLPCLLGTQSLIDSLKLLRLTDVTLACEDV